MNADASEGLAQKNLETEYTQGHNEAAGSARNGKNWYNK